MRNLGGCNVRCRDSLQQDRIVRRRQGRVRRSADATYAEGRAWLWSWSFAVPKSSKSQDAAKRFIEWSTSKEYITLVGNDIGWASLPPGTRQSTYARPEYKQAAPFSEFVLNAIDTANPNDSTLKKVPYSGVQYVVIPEFQSFGTLIGQQIAGALAGQISVDQALQGAQAAADRTVGQAGYQK